MSGEFYFDKQFLVRTENIIKEECQTEFIDAMIATLSNLCDIGQRFFILHQHLGKLQALFWVDAHDIPQKKDPIWSVAHLGRKKNTNIQGFMIIISMRSFVQ